MMSIVRRLRLLGFDEIIELLVSDLNPRLATGAVWLYGDRGAHHLAVELRKSIRGARRHVKSEVRHSQCHASETASVGCVNPNAVSPRANRLNAIVALTKGKSGIFEVLAHAFEPIQQSGMIRNNKADRAPQHVRRIS